MSIKQIIRSFWSICLCCIVFLHLLSTPVYADTNSNINSFTGGFWKGLGEFVGGAAGAVTVCYVTDVAIAPIAPPVAAILAPICPAIGSLVGGSAGAIGVSKVVAPAF